ncbi:MAG: hypothetical protein R2705_21350 [Ilumatobacteraceae bacterium]
MDYDWLFPASEVPLPARAMIPNIAFLLDGTFHFKAAGVVPAEVGSEVVGITPERLRGLALPRWAPGLFGDQAGGRSDHHAGRDRPGIVPGARRRQR